MEEIRSESAADLRGGSIQTNGIYDEVMIALRVTEIKQV